MGKYQLDNKGIAQVKKFHEKNSAGASSNDPKARIVALRNKFQKKPAK